LFQAIDYRISLLNIRLNAVKGTFQFGGYQVVPASGTTDSDGFAKTASEYDSEAI